MRMIGACSVPLAIGFIHASWPLAALTVNDAGIEVSLQPGWLNRLIKRLFRNSLEPVSNESLWAVEWSEITAINHTLKSVFLNAKGSKGCRFRVLDEENLIQLIGKAEELGVITRKVRTTFPRLL